MPLKGLWSMEEPHQSVSETRSRERKEKKHTLSTLSCDTHCLIKGMKHDVQGGNWE